MTLPLGAITGEMGFSHIFALLLDGVSVGQQWADRTNGGQVHGSSEDRTARLVPEHVRRRDLAEQRFSQTGQKVGGSDSRSFGRVFAGAPKIKGTQ